GFRDRRGADAHAGIVAPGGLDDDRLTLAVDRPARQADAGGGLERDRYRDVLASGDAAEHAAVVVADESLRCHLVAVLAALLRDRAEAGADLDALHRVDAHHRRGDVGVQAPVYGFSPAHRHAFGNDVHARPARVAALAQFVHEFFQLWDLIY